MVNYFYNSNLKIKVNSKKWQSMKRKLIKNTQKGNKKRERRKNTQQKRENHQLKIDEMNYMKWISKCVRTGR